MQSDASTEATEIQKKSYRTRVKIMNAFLSLMEKKDFTSIKVKAVVEKAEITRGTFYLYFSDIFGLVTYMENTLLDGIPDIPTYSQGVIDPRIAPSYELCHDTNWEAEWFQYYHDNHQALNALLGPHGDPSFHNKICKYLQNVLASSMKRDHMPEDNIKDYFISLLPDIYLMIAKEWTSDSSYQNLDLKAIISIAGTIRIGSMYNNYLEWQHKNKHNDVE